MKVRFPRPTGITSARLIGAQRILAERARSARKRAANADPDSQHAAALRGKAKAYDEAAEMLAKVTQGRPLRGRHDDANPGAASYRTARAALPAATSEESHD